MKIYTGYYNSTIGNIEIKANENSIISIKFVDFKNTGKIYENRIISKIIEDIDKYFRGELKEFKIEYELNGTDFQKSVWQSLSTIPYGKRVSYEEIAEIIGNKKAVRAVASAIGKNNLLILIPCHRVIGKNGKIRGYSGGIDKKIELLNLEKLYIK